MTESPSISDSAPALRLTRLGLRRGAVVFGVFWLTFAGVNYEKPGWNVNSRFALTRAIVEKGSFMVDGYVNTPEGGCETEDRALKNGHYYSDKIIGVSLLGVPPYAAIRWIAHILGTQPPLELARYVTTVFSVSVCAALAATAMMSLLLAFGARIAEALILTIAMSFGTLLWGYSSLFYSYLPAVCFCLFAYNLLLRARLEQRLTPRALIAPGLCLGASLLCEYTVGIVALALSGYVFWHARPRWAVVVFWLAAAIALLPFAVYTLICFGEICVPYKYLENPVFQKGMGEGLQGIAQFRLPILYYITIHPYRGLFVLSPFLAFSLIGLGRMIADGVRHEGATGAQNRIFLADAILCGAIFIGYLWFNASYYMWWGGAAMGPRHLIPALPFLIPPLLWILQWGRGWACLMALALAASIWLVGVPAMVDPQPVTGFPMQTLFHVDFYHSKFLLNSPVFTRSWPAFFDGRAAWNRATPYALRGPWYFLLLSAAWIAGARAVLRIQTKKA
ncbi:MAG: hypothetical protein NTX50_18285 [Candidatus Sumerlaeota bacterium]|nr:hypothetical protein [Candidatus Sumerlaeota bacterium]